MARTARKPLRTFTFPVCDLADNAIPDCEVRYNREDGYSAHYHGSLLGYADSKDEAETMCKEAAWPIRLAA